MELERETTEGAQRTSRRMASISAGKRINGKGERRGTKRVQPARGGCSRKEQNSFSVDRSGMAQACGTLARAPRRQKLFDGVVERENAFFRALLPIGPPWRLRIRAKLILASAPQDKRTLVPCHWQGAELAKPFAKALSPSPVPHLLTLSRAHSLLPVHRSFVFLLVVQPPLVLTARWIPPQTKLGRLPATMHEGLRAIWVTISSQFSLCVVAEDFARPGESADLIPPPARLSCALAHVCHDASNNCPDQSFLSATWLRRITKLVGTRTYEKAYSNCTILQSDS